MKTLLTGGAGYIGSHTAVAMLEAGHEVAVVDNYYKLNFTIDEVRPFYSFDETCQGSVPQAIELFLESSSFENAVQLAISLGGDCDTIACMVGSIAGQYYEVPDKVNEYNISKLSDDLKEIYINL